jgi:hypothetical protein
MDDIFILLVTSTCGSHMSSVDPTCHPLFFFFPPHLIFFLELGRSLLGHPPRSSALAPVQLAATCVPLHCSLPVPAPHAAPTCTIAPRVATRRLRPSTPVQATAGTIAGWHLEPLLLCRSLPTPMPQLRSHLSRVRWRLEPLLLGRSSPNPTPQLHPHLHRPSPTSASRVAQARSSAPPVAAPAPLAAHPYTTSWLPLRRAPLQLAHWRSCPPNGLETVHDGVEVGQPCPLVLIEWNETASIYSFGGSSHPISTPIQMQVYSGWTQPNSPIQTRVYSGSTQPNSFQPTNQTRA